MAQVSTGLGLAILGGCILGAAALTSHNFGSEAMAQGTGTERRIVYTTVQPIAQYGTYYIQHFAYRIWSDNSIEMRPLGRTQMGDSPNLYFNWQSSTSTSSNAISSWTTIDNGTSGFRPLTDVDMSGETDAGDISQVLLDFNTRSDDLPPPPIDCTINSPR